MLQLFPVYKKRLLLNVGLWIAFLAVSIILYPSIPTFVVLLAAIVGTLVFLFIQTVQATTMHTRLLNILYNELDAERFVRQYEPLLDMPLKNNQLYLMVRLHLSNAYCAQGRFEDAMRLLNATEIRKDTQEKMILSRFAITSNLCYCAEQMNDLPEAEKKLSDLLAVKAELEALQLSKPEKKRMIINTALNEQCMKFMKTGAANVDFLKTQVQAANTQQLHRVTTSLWIARAYLAQNNRREAEKLLNRIVELAPDLYPGKCARELLNQMPAKNS